MSWTAAGPLDAGASGLQEPLPLGHSDLVSFGRGNSKPLIWLAPATRPRLREPFSRLLLGTNRQIRRGSYRSTKELVQAIEDYLAVHNEDPKPFVWTKSADDILESLQRYCERITATGH